MTAQSIHSSTSAPDVAENQLQNGSGANDLRTARMLRPTHRIDDRADFLHVAIFANGGEEIGGFDKLILGNPGDAFNHLRRVTRVLLLQQLKDTARVLQRKIVSDIGRQHRRWFLSRLAHCSGPAGTLMTTTIPRLL